jgi:hypothetical protein
MPSAEKSSSASTALENPAPIVPGSAENTSNENQDEKSVQSQNSIQQVVSIISNKIRNLEKRKVGEGGGWRAVGGRFHP